MYIIENGSKIPHYMSEKVTCSSCGESWRECQQKIFGLYCTDYVYYKFRCSPTTYDRKDSTAQFTKGFNRALDYHKFKMTGKLIPKAKYFPPACLKYELKGIIEEIEGEIEDYVKRERKISLNDPELPRRSKQSKEDVSVTSEEVEAAFLTKRGAMIVSSHFLNATIHSMLLIARHT